MKVLFLDIDGVLNMFGNSYRTFMKPYGQHIEPHIVQRLNYVMESVPELSIVISSSWRLNMEDLQKQLMEQGFKHWERVIGHTPSLDARGQEIIAWMVGKEIQRYLVLDDESFDICGEKCDVIPRECFIQTDMNEGLLNKDAMFIVNYFNEPKDSK